MFQNFIKKFVGEKQADLIKDCNTFLAFVTDKEQTKKKLYKNNMCKNRFCPMCAWRRARKDALGLSLMMQYIKQEEKKEFIFLTLTTPNVKAEDPNYEIQKYNKSFKKLVERKKVKAMMKCYVRKLEITYNKQRDDALMLDLRTDFLLPCKLIA